MGYSDFVELQLTVREAGQVQAWLEAKRGPEQMADAMEKMGRKGKVANDTLTASLDQTIAKYTSLSGVIAIAQRGLDFFMEANRRAMQEGKQSTQTMDESMRRIMVQGGLPGLNQSQLSNIVSRSAIRAAVPVTFAASAAEQAISGGFTAKDILQNGGLDSFLQFANATNSTREDPTQLVKSIGLFLGSTGQDLTTANMRRTMVGVQRLFKGTNMQSSALPFLAREGSQITEFGGLSGDDTLALGAVLLNTLGEEKAATSFRGSVTDLATLGKDKQKVEGLGRMGLKPGDVDMVGESFVQVLERVNAAANRLDPAARKVVMSQVFKTESLPGVMALMSDKGRGKFAEYRALMGDEAGFMGDVEIASSGEAAEMRRQAARRMVANDKRGLAGKAIATEEVGIRAIESSDPDYVAAIKDYAAPVYSSLGMDPRRADSLGDLFNYQKQGFGRGAREEIAAARARSLDVTVRLIDEDNRTVPFEQRGKGIEEQGR